MFLYYLANIFLIVIGAISFTVGYVITWTSLGENYPIKDWYGIFIGSVLLLIGIGLWWIAGSWYPSDFIN